MGAIPETVTESGVVPADIVTLIPYPVARRLKAISVAASAKEITVLMAEGKDGEAVAEIEATTGRRVILRPASVHAIDLQLDRLAGTLDAEDLWLQRRHIHSLGRLVDHSLNLGQMEEVRALVERALEFAPYSVDLWLLKARVATQRKEVVQALSVASQVAPNDRRILRWINSLEELGGDETPATENPPNQRKARVSQASEPASCKAPAEKQSTSVPTEDSGRAVRSGPNGGAGKSDTAIAPSAMDSAFEAARKIAGAHDMVELLQLSAERLRGIAGADSASLFFRRNRGWAGWSTHPLLQAELSRAFPKKSRLSAQVLRQGLPIVVTDVDSRAEDVGGLIRDTNIKSFALLPVIAAGTVAGLAYLNWDSADRSNVIFDDVLGRSIGVILTCAGASAAAIQQKQGLSNSPALDEITGTYTSEQFERQLASEIERASRYRLSVSVLRIDVFEEKSESSRLTREELLFRQATSIQTTLRGSDVLGRKASDGFLLMLPQTTLAGAQAAAGRLHMILTEPVGKGDDEGTSVAIGISAFPDHGDEVAALMDSAEKALDKAKGLEDSQTAVAEPLQA